MGTLRHYVNTSQLLTTQVTSEMGVGKYREEEVFYLMMMLVDKILYHEWKMNIIKASRAMTLALKNQNLRKNLSTCYSLHHTSHRHWK